jgi:ribokinase
MEQEGGRVVVVGSLNADLTVRTDRLPRAGETVHGSALVVAPGGKSANQAAAAARLGARVAMVGAVGEDDHGDLLLRELRGAGVEVQGVLRLPGVATGTALITVDRAGENTIVISAGANGELRPDRLAGLAKLLQGASVLCLCFEVPMETVVSAALQARDAGARVLLNPSPAAPIPDRLLEAVDLLLLNGSEAADLLETRGDWDATASRLRRRGGPAAIVTLGGDGALVLEEGRVTPIPAIPIKPVDTTGAGDAFTGAVAARLAAGAPLAEAARFAARAAAWSATRPGAQPSYATLAQLEAWAARDRA